MDEASSTTPMMLTKSKPVETKSHTCTTRELMRDVVNAGLHMFHVLCSLGLLIAVILQNQDGQTVGLGPYKPAREVGAHIDQGEFIILKIASPSDLISHLLI